MSRYIGLSFDYIFDVTYNCKAQGVSNANNFFGNPYFKNKCVTTLELN